MSGKPAAPADPTAPPRSVLSRILSKIWWLHSFVALAFGVGVMLFARAGLAYADKFLLALLLSWTLMFVALRFIVGPANRRPDENMARKGVRVATNYIIKQFYQQMFFFLVPLYASSATWTFASMNWVWAPILLVCAVVSTMDLIFDNYVMERRWLASLMYGLALFGLINVLVPLVFHFTHLSALIIAAAATPAAVALLSFSARSVFSSQGLILTIGGTGGLLLAVWLGRGFIPPVPMAMPDSTVGHGVPGAYECMPANKHVLLATQLDQLRCGSLVREPGGIKEDLVHTWRHQGHVVATLTPEQLHCDGDDVVFRSTVPADKLPENPVGTWSCTTSTKGGQLVGMRSFSVVAAPVAVPVDAPVVPSDAAPPVGNAPGADGSAATPSP